MLQTVNNCYKTWAIYNIININYTKWKTQSAICKTQSAICQRMSLWCARQMNFKKYSVIVTVEITKNYNQPVWEIFKTIYLGLTVAYRVLWQNIEMSSVQFYFTLQLIKFLYSFEILVLLMVTILQNWQC